MDKPSYEQALLQPSIPSSSLPINLTVFRGSASPPSTTDIECQNGDIYIGSMDIYIFRDGKWERWDPANPFRLDLYGDILDVVPCHLQGIRLTSGPDIEVEPMTSRDIIQLINRLLWNIEAMSTNMGASGTGAGEDSSKITTAITGEPVGKGRRKRKADADTETLENAATAKKEGKGKGKGKGKEKESSSDIKTSGEHLQAPSEPKRRRTTSEEGGTRIPVRPLLDGISCPEKTPIIEWKKLGINTYAPWFSPIDKKAVEHMAGAARAQEYPCMVVELKYDNSALSARILMSKIEDAISSGCAVLVRGWEPSPSLSFVEEDIGLYRPTLSQQVSVQDAVKRARQQARKSKADLSDVHRTVTLKEFIDLAKNKKECLNLLDLPNTQPEIPIFLRPLSDNVNARSITMNDCYLPREGPDNGKEFFGVQTIHGDTERLRGWDLMTHGGFLTYPHHDAGGLCTYITVRSGTKVWGYFNVGTGSTTTRNELFDAWDEILSLDQEMNFNKYPLGVVLLEKGDTLIQPPGAPHMVYTPQSGLTSGGHFLSYSTMHLTEVSVGYDCSKHPGEDVERELVATNAAHPSLYRYIIWMILALPKFASDHAKIFRLKPLLALIAFVENANRYNSAEATKLMPCTTDVRRDVMAREVRAEMEKAKEIITRLKNGLGVTDVASRLEEGSWSDPGPVCNIKTIFD
ncbi:hypothetical protein BKA83DRAFT_4497885 [Pisolithus microcarpus]|nr:hypothetical protein BKA83DRAFT_4497885 [Pisolithus microcarpus]